MTQPQLESVNATERQRGVSPWSAWLKLWPLLLFALWWIIFSIGMFVPSRDVRDRIRANYVCLTDPASDKNVIQQITTSTSAPAHSVDELKFRLTVADNPLYVMWLLTAAAFAALPTNLALLCVVSAMLGAATLNSVTRNPSSASGGNSAVADDRPDAEREERPESAEIQLPPSTTAAHLPLATAAIHGLIVMMILLSGMIVLDGNLNWDKQTDAGQYLRLAATASLFSIAAGTNPKFIYQIAELFSIDRRMRGGK